MTLPGFFQGTGMPDPDWWQALWPDPSRVLADCGVRAGMHVVDLCCGDGWFTVPLARLAASVTAIDIDAELVEAARCRVADAGLANCRFVVGDAYDLATVMTGRADHVFLANVFHGVPDKPRLARAVREVLVDGGLFAVVAWHARPREETVVLGAPRGPATELRMTPQATIAAVEAGGLALRQVCEVSPFHYAAVFERQ